MSKNSVIAPGNQLAGFRVLMHIGKGAASDIYAVQDQKSKQVWALKHVIKNNEKDQRFLDQAILEHEVGQKLDHPNLRRVIKLIKHRKRFRVAEVSLVMELIDAVGLEQRLPRTYVQAVEVFRQVASALAHMHDRGFIHADLKPSNILITEKGDVKLIDLGQSCSVGTIKKRIQGTPGYMAPEQAHRQAITQQTDIYNFGATMYWVLVRDVIPTALPPKGDDSNGAIYSGAIEAEQIPPPVPPHEKNPLIPQLLSKLVLDCVKVEPYQRPASMREVIRRLDLIHDVLTQPQDANGATSSAAADETSHGG